MCSNVYGMNDNYIIVSSLKAETVSYLYISHSPWQTLALNICLICASQTEVYGCSPQGAQQVIDI